MAASDLLQALAITGTGAATATATLAAGVAGQRGYVCAASVEVTAGTATLCRLELRGSGTTVYAVTFPVQAAATATGGQITFPCFVPISASGQNLNIVATTTGATTTNVYGIVCYGA